jgi:CRISPR-associated endonuclease/helicase Cas3
MGDRSSVTELKNFRQQDKEAARDFLTRVKSLFPLIEIPEFWDDDNGIAFLKISRLFPLR